MVIWITRGWEHLKALAVILWPVRFILLILLVIAAVFSLSQGQDALYGAIVEGRSRYWVLAAIVLWAVQTWYWARFLLYLPMRAFPVRRYGGPPFDDAFVRRRITRIPRCLGAAVFVIVAVFIMLASANSSCPDNQRWCEGGGFWWWRCLCGPIWAGVSLLAGLVFVLFTVARRAALQRWARPPVDIPDASPATFRAAMGFASVWILLLGLGAASAIWDFPMIAKRVGGVAVVLVLFGASLWTILRLGLPAGTRAFIIVLIGFNTGLFLVTIFAASEVGIYFGPAVALILNAGIWVGATSFFLVLPGERLRLPVTTLFVAGMLVFSLVPAVIRFHSGEYDNHRVRPLEPAAMALGEADKRMTLRQAFGAWKAQAPCLDQACTKRPMILVAAQGGASRSGYWVATVLGGLEDALANSASADRAFHKSLFAISSVSGGSLGAAAYQRLIARGAKGGASLCQGSNSYAVCGQRVVEQDFLGAVFFSAFGPDLLQRLLPGNLLPDRAEALEHAWELAWEDAVGANDFAEEFRPRETAESGWLPVLLLNGTSVKTGRRVVTSDIAIQPACKSSDIVPATPDMPSAVDFFCLTQQRLRLSTAVHNSARFPYISPAGTLWASDNAGNSWKADAIDDGGYFEAQGSTTLFDLLAALQQPCDEQNACKQGEAWTDDVVPVVLSIQNDPARDPEPCDNAKRGTPGCPNRDLGEEGAPMDWVMRLANDLLAPPIGLASSRSGRGAYAARMLEVELYREKKFAWPALRVNLRGAQDVDPGVAPAMSWYLSQRSLRDMAGDLCDGPPAAAPADPSLCQHSRELDNNICRIGQALIGRDLLNDIRGGEGCRSLKQTAAQGQQKAAPAPR